MAVDTEIQGSPSSIEAAGDWLTGTLRTGIDHAADAVADARRSAGSSWRGPAGEQFAARAGGAVSTIDDLSSSTRGVATSLHTFAARLRSAQDRMATIREKASGAGLAVSGFVIADPGPGPANPGSLPPGGMPSPAAAQAHSQAVAAFDAHQDKIRAYNAAVRDAGAVQDDIRTGSHALSDSYRGLQGANWLTNGGDLMGGLGGAVAEFQATTLRGTADTLGRTAREFMETARNADPAIVGREKWYSDLEKAGDDVRKLDDLAKHADDLDRASTRVPLKLGGALTIAGIGYDIATGKDPVQATASGLGGFAASVGTGALIGTAIGGPVGTAVGVVVGAGVGIFTSGAIDSLFENGPDVGEAFDAGVDAVKDTGEAVGDAVGGAVSAVGGLFD
jgi:hypothetical protein